MSNYILQNYFAFLIISKEEIKGTRKLNIQEYLYLTHGQVKNMKKKL